MSTTQARHAKFFRERFKDSELKPIDDHVPSAGDNKIVRVVESVLKQGLSKINKQLQDIGAKSVKLRESVDHVVRLRGQEATDRQRTDPTVPDDPEERQQRFLESLDNREIEVEAHLRHQAAVKSQRETDRIMYQCWLNPPETPYPDTNEDFCRAL